MSTVSAYPSLDNILGASLLTAAVDCVLVGVISGQFNSFLYRFGQGNRRDTALVSVLYAANVISSILSMATGYFWLVTSFGNYAVLKLVPVTFEIQSPIGGFVAATVQIFFAYRIYILTGRKLLLPGIIGFMTFVALCFATFLTYAIASVGREFSKFVEYSWAVTVALTLAPVIDLTIACLMIYYIKKIKSTSVQTTSFIDSILRTTVETNVATSLVSITFLILFKIPSTGLFYTVTSAALPKIYLSSVLLSFNSRPSATQVEATTKSTPAAGNRLAKSAVTRSRLGVAHSIVQVTMEQDIDIDIMEKEDYIRMTRSPGSRVRIVTPPVQSS